MKTPKPKLIITALLLLFFFVLQSCQNRKHQNSNPDKGKAILVDHTFEFTNNKLIKNRTAHFIAQIKRINPAIRNIESLITKTSTNQSFHQLANNLNIDPFELRQHIELAKLIQIGLSEIDAQVLLFSHSNYQNPFTGETMNPKILAQANPEDILSNILGWSAGSYDPLVQIYRINLVQINDWISTAKES